MKKILINAFCIIFFTTLGLVSSRDAKSEELMPDEAVWCHTAWIPQANTNIIRCGLCDVLPNKRGSWAGSICPPT